MADDPPLVRPATPGELTDVRGMHTANRAAWDEAAERYEAWFDEAVALIRSGGTAAGGPSTSNAQVAATRFRFGTTARTRSSASTSARACSSWPHG